ncbi:MAG TPA: S8 family serine peptidase, partial [Candidatus Limnocylindria bacterium]|nr:S8 family serine peptidase [Candidatus Limnocylindria bacterium]
EPLQLPPLTRATKSREPRINGVEWGIDRIGAPQLWSLGVTGTGIVVGNIDSGVQYDHPALVGQYRGRLSGGGYNHDFNWYDPTGTCTGAPCDNNGHGTHTMGTIVGDDGSTNQIGVAPGARWIAAKGCEGVSCSRTHLLKSAQWILAPCPIGTAPGAPACDASKRPHVVNNSWGGGPGNDWYLSMVNAWAAAGIMPVFANGNEGPACSTSGSPGDYGQSYSAGAFESSNEIAYFSSRGPSAFGGIKPDIAAPGANIRSSTPGGGYAAFDGTSMAAPHVAGAVALLWSASPPLRGDIGATRGLLDGAAIDVNQTTCGGTAAKNNVWGEGRLDVAAAYGQIGVSGSLKGTLTNAATGQPITGASIEATGPSPQVTVTDNLGRYQFNAIAAGSYTLTARRFGFVAAAGEAAVTAGASTTRDITLAPRCTAATYVERFDRQAAPALPAGWVTTTAVGPAPPWQASGSGSPSPVAASAPNAAAVDGPASISDKQLLSPSIAVRAAAARLAFSQNVALEMGYDGGVLEISIAGAAFTDIVAAGGSFEAGGYGHTLKPQSSFGNPLGGRSAWSGTSGAFTTTVVSLPPAAAGKSIVLRWRLGSDSSVGGGGWRIDDVTLTDELGRAATPCRPTGVGATAGKGRATVKWRAPVVTGSSPISSYVVTSRPDGRQCTAAGALTCEVTGLRNGIAYTFTVRARNAAGTGPASAASRKVTPRGVPAAPTSVSARAGDQRATVSWVAPKSDGGSPISRYVVIAAPGKKKCETSGLSCTITGLTNGVRYSFTVRAINAIGASKPSDPSPAVVPKARL